MTNLLYLLGAAAVSLLGCAVLWLRNRKPRSMDAHIRAFHEQLEAIAPERPADGGRTLGARE